MTSIYFVRKGEPKRLNEFEQSIEGLPGISIGRYHLPLEGNQRVDDTQISDHEAVVFITEGDDLKLKVTLREGERRILEGYGLVFHEAVAKQESSSLRRERHG